MKTKITFLFLILLGFSFTSLEASDDKKKPIVLVKSSATEIENALKESLNLSNLIEQSGMDYNALKAENPSLVETQKLSMSAGEDMLVGSGDEPPLGVPGILWGLVLTLLGVAIVYFSMDEGDERKKQVRMSFLGCLISTLIFGGLRLVDNDNPMQEKLDKTEYKYDEKAQRA